jgi:hypothetical protein
MGGRSQHHNTAKETFHAMSPPRFTSSLFAGTATRSQFAFGIAIVLGCLWAALGAWALVAPESFYVTIAPFAPYNQHFLHDVGAFQLGLGVALLLALRWNDGLIVALGANVVAGAAHMLSHVMDSQLGGHAYDIPNLTLLVLLPLLGLALRARATGGTGQPPSVPPPGNRLPETSTSRSG